jgi:aminoglycoside/choline kinase family phosphotransferase
LVNGKNFMQFKLKKISGDASFREFYRVQKRSTSTILVKANKDKFKNLITYAAINKLLIDNKIKTPKLVKEYFNHGMMEIEDLGFFSFIEHIKSKKNKFEDYKKLIDIIIKLQNIKLKKFIKIKHHKINFVRYTLSELQKESDLFFDWYLKNNCKRSEFKKNKSKIKKELISLYKRLHYQNRCFVHRDFHASNIMIKKKSFGLIDSQDLLIGNLLYDPMSLIDDVRIKLPLGLKYKLFDYYLLKTKKVDKKEKTLAKNDFDILSIQRNLRILGIFVRLCKRDNKSNYLKFLPYTWELLQLRLKNPIFKYLCVLLNKAVPLKKRTKVNFYAD